MSKSGIITVSLNHIKSLPDKERHALRNYVMGGSQTEARYRDEPEVRKILFWFPDAQLSQAVATKREEPITDSDRIDALEKFVRSRGPLLLHTSRDPDNKGFPGLGFWDGLRDLRGALDVLVESARHKESDDRSLGTKRNDKATTPRT